MSKPAGSELRNLEDIWAQQAALNKQAGFDTREMGRALAAEERAARPPESGDMRVSVGIAIKNYLDALVAECMELQDCLYWKHWYKEAKEGRQYALRDLQNSRVEAIDMLFFWVSICQLLGLEPADILRLYGKKLDINLRRQREGRSQAEHAEHEGENKDVV